MPTEFFSDNYFEAKDRFIETALKEKFEHTAIPLTATGPDGQPLTIDVAWTGAVYPEQLIIHSSGLHGVEGFSGSAIQLAALHQDHKLSPKAALVFVHCLNPYGMSWLRRANENNVDLNRNWMRTQSENSFAGSSEGYKKMNALLCPTSPPAFDFFLVRALFKILRYGFKNLKNAVALGQYDFPQGLFFGGTHLEQGPSRYYEFLKPRLKNTKQLVLIDVHTGLGPYGQETVFFSESHKSSKKEEIQKKLSSRHLDIFSSDSATGYTIKGSMGEFITNELDNMIIDSFITEFGTVSGLKLISILRDENRHHLFGDATLNHKSKKRLKDAFAPHDVKWHNQVVAQGLATLNAAIQSYLE